MTEIKKGDLIRVSVKGTSRGVKMTDIREGVVSLVTATGII